MIVTFTQEEVREIMINHVSSFLDLSGIDEEDISVWVDVPSRGGQILVEDGDLVNIMVVL